MIPAKIFIHRGLFRSVHAICGTAEDGADPKRAVAKGDEVIVQNWAADKATKATVVAVDAANNCCSVKYLKGGATDTLELEGRDTSIQEAREKHTAAMSKAVANAGGVRATVLKFDTMKLIQNDDQVGSAIKIKTHRQCNQHTSSIAV
jgi:hypothetical protein